MARPIVLVVEPLAQEGLAALRDGGIDVRNVISGSREAVLAELRDADGLIVRSKTKVDGTLLDAAPSLRVVGRAGVGVDTIDVAGATRRGIIVLNTPEASTLATAEHTIAMMLASYRHIPLGTRKVLDGEWSSKGLMGRELAAATLGVVGLGRIGAAVTTRAKAFGMTVLAHDAFVSDARAESLGAKLVPLDELLSKSDIVTLHAPLTPQTQKMMGAREFGLMRPGCLLVNCARGGLVDEDALLAALDSRRFGGAAIDVVSEEPPPPEHPVWKLLRHPKVVATPHLGGSTYESQTRIATDLCKDMVAVLCGQPPANAVNAPVAAAADARPFVQLAYALGRAYPQMADEQRLPSLALVLEGDLRSHDPRPFVAAFLVGLLQNVTDRRVSSVNAEEVARELGIAVEALGAACDRGFARAVAVRGGRTSIAGTVVHGQQLRIVEVDGFEVDMLAQGHLIMTRHRDVPGIVGKAGTLLGEAAINISNMQVARSDEGGEAMMLLGVDRAVPAAVLARLRDIGELQTVRSIEL